MINQWNIAPIYDIPKWFQDIVQEYTKNIPTKGDFVSQLLWHRGIREEKELHTFLDSVTINLHHLLILDRR